MKTELKMAMPVACFVVCMMLLPYSAAGQQVEPTDPEPATIEDDIETLGVMQQVDETNADDANSLDAMLEDVDWAAYEDGSLVRAELVEYIGQVHAQARRSRLVLTALSLSREIRQKRDKLSATLKELNPTAGR